MLQDIFLLYVKKDYLCIINQRIKEMKSSNYLSALVLILSFGLFSCGEKSNDPIVTPDPTPVPVVPAPEVQKPAGNDYLSRLEVPKTKDGNIFIYHCTKEGNDSVMTYCLEFDPKKYHSRWVAFSFDALTIQQNTKRPETDPFADDPSLPAKYQVESGGFGSTYTDLNGQNQTMRMDRGHLCASADRLYSVTANEQTFYMSNMSPQLHSFNSYYWLAFEQFVQDYPRIKQNGKYVLKSTVEALYVTKGGTIADDQILGFVNRGNGASVAVPKYYFMALLCKMNTGSYKAIGFLMEHKEYGYNDLKEITSEDMKKSVVTIDELESATGIDFFHNLPDDIESKVEATCDPALWNL